MGAIEPFAESFASGVKRFDNLAGTFLQVECWIYDLPIAKQKCYPHDKDNGRVLYLKWGINTLQYPKWRGYRA